MKRVFLVIGAVLCVIAVVGWWSSSRAQQPSEDPKLSPYRQLLTRANEELVQAMAQANALAVENAQLKAEIAKLKAPADNKD